MAVTSVRRPLTDSRDVTSPRKRGNSNSENSETCRRECASKGLV